MLSANSHGSSERVCTLRGGSASTDRMSVRSRPFDNLATSLNNSRPEGKPCRGANSGEYGSVTVGPRTNSREFFPAERTSVRDHQWTGFEQISRAGGEYSERG